MRSVRAGGLGLQGQLTLALVSAPKAVILSHFRGCQLRNLEVICLTAALKSGQKMFPDTYGMVPTVTSFFEVKDDMDMVVV